MATTTEPADGSPDLLDDAREALRTEHRRVGDEYGRSAPSSSRVASVPSEPIRPTAARDRSRAVAVQSESPGEPARSEPPAPPARAAGGSGLVAVRDAYQETVMSVPHYEIEYDDTYQRSVAEECGPELAYALTRGSRFHAECKRSPDRQSRDRYRGTRAIRRDDPIGDGVGRAGRLPTRPDPE